MEHCNLVQVKVTPNRCFTKLVVKAHTTKAIARRCSVKKVFSEISQNLQENTCSRVRPATLLKKRLWRRWFPVNFAKFLRTSFLTEHLRWLLLSLMYNKPLSPSSWNIMKSILRYLGQINCEHLNKILVLD